MVLLEFNSIYKSIVCFHLKHSSFWPSADIKPKPNELSHAMHWQCMFAPSLYECTMISLALRSYLQLVNQGILKGKHHCTVDLLFDWFGLVCFANKNKNCQLSYSWFQTSQTGDQWYSDTSPFSSPWVNCHLQNIPQAPACVFVNDTSVWRNKR